MSDGEAADSKTTKGESRGSRLLPARPYRPSIILPTHRLGALGHRDPLQRPGFDFPLHGLMKCRLIGQHDRIPNIEDQPGRKVIPFALDDLLNGLEGRGPKAGRRRDISIRADLLLQLVIDGLPKADHQARQTGRIILSIVVLHMIIREHARREGEERHAPLAYQLASSAMAACANSLCATSSQAGYLRPLNLI